MSKITLKDVPAKWRAREDFDCNGTLKGESVNGYLWGCGRLNPEELVKLERDKNNIVFVVHSYKTPIAWVLQDGTEYKVRQRFTGTTSRHAGRLY